VLLALKTFDHPVSSWSTDEQEEVAALHATLRSMAGAFATQHAQYKTYKDRLPPEVGAKIAALRREVARNGIR